MKRLLLLFALVLTVCSTAMAQDGPAKNEIWYTSSDGQIVTPNDQTDFGGVNIVSNEYDKEKGMYCITFDGDVESIGESAFSNCSSLASISLPSGVTSLETDVFLKCSSLASISLPNGITSIGFRTFCECSNLTSISLPSGLKSIGQYAFSNCSSLTDIYLPSGVTSIGKSCFGECSSLTTIKLPDGVTSIEMGVFSNCSSLTNINLPSGITSIGENAFINCSSLTYIVLPNDVNYIGSFAFKDCSGLTYISLPAKLKEMGKCPFEGCTNLEYAQFLGTTPPIYPEQQYPSIPTYPFTKCGTDIVGGTILLVPDDAVNAYTEARYTDNVVCESSKHLSTIKSTALNDIETAMKGVTLTQNDADIVATCQANIGSTNDISIIIIEKERALSVIYLQKVKDEPLVIIDAVLDKCTGLLTLDEIEALKESKRKILEYTDKKQVYAVMQIVWPIVKNYAKNDLQSYYDGENYLKEYFALIDNAESWAEIENIIKEAMKALDNMPHFVIGDKRYFVTKRENYEYNHAADYTGGNIYFQDGVRYESNSKNFITQGEIEYTRTLPEGVWQCWYEPFDVQVDTEKFDAAEVAGILTNAQGETVVAFNKLEDGALMHPNTIYVIRAKEGQGNLEIANNAQWLYPSEETKLDLRSAYEDFVLTGNYSPVEHGEWYTLDGTGKFSKMSSGSLKPQRFYLTITPRNDAYYGKDHSFAKQFIDMMVLGDEETTGIEEASPKSSPEGKDFIYNLQGQRVNSIQKGQIYIMNGKKYVAK